MAEGKRWVVLKIGFREESEKDFEASAVRLR